MKRRYLSVFRYALALSVLSLALLAGSSLMGRELLRSFAKVLTPTAEPKTPNTLQDETRRGRVEAEVITILPTGFQPAQITRPRGRFLILIDNQSDSDDLTLRLNSVNGQRLREVRQKKEERLLRQLEDLPPGEYLLTASAGTEEWVCRITITPN